MTYLTSNPDYTRWENYGPLLEFVQKHDLWETFSVGLHENTPGGLHVLLNPETGCAAIDKFFCGGE